MHPVCPICGILYRVRRLDRVLVAAVLLLVGAVAVDALRGRDGDRSPGPTQQAERPSPTVPLERAEPRPAPSSGLRAVSSGPAAAASAAEAPVPEEVRLVPSSTTFLPRCPTKALSLVVGPGPQLVLRFSGPRCHVPPLRLRATIRDSDERVVYRGSALAAEELSGNFAGRGVRRARLMIGCRTEQLVATVTGYGLEASGPIRCRGSH
jgi:hypothetical protein